MVVIAKKNPAVDSQSVEHKTYTFKQNMLSNLCPHNLTTFISFCIVVPPISSVAIHV
jgi:hypothetical protein